MNNLSKLESVPTDIKACAECPTVMCLGTDHYSSDRDLLHFA